MRILTDDGQFGFVISPFNENGMFRFQFVIDGELIGDEDPCFLTTAMGQLGSLPHLQDERLGQLSSDSNAVLSILLCEEELHDRSTLAIAESMDSWLIHAYVYEGNVVVIARAYEDTSLTDTTRIKVISSAEYDAVFEVTYSYWSRTNGLAK